MTDDEVMDVATTCAKRICARYRIMTAPPQGSVIVKVEEMAELIFPDIKAAARESQPHLVVKDCTFSSGDEA